MFTRLHSCLLAVLTSTLVFSSVAESKVFDSEHTISKLDYSPPFLTPVGGEIWTAGARYSASWDTSAIDNGTYPEQNVSHTADLVLGWREPNSTSLNLHYTLKMDVPLYAPASNTVNFTLPVGLMTRDTYFLVLLGSTHNVSPQFTIISSNATDIMPATQQRLDGPRGRKGL